MSLRVIFREVQGKVEVIQIVVIGKRENETVYKIAWYYVKKTGLEYMIL